MVNGIQLYAGFAGSPPRAILMRVHPFVCLHLLCVHASGGPPICRTPPMPDSFARLRGGNTISVEGVLNDMQTAWQFVKPRLFGAIEALINPSHFAELAEKLVRAEARLKQADQELARLEAESAEAVALADEQAAALAQAQAAAKQASVQAAEAADAVEGALKQTSAAVEHAAKRLEVKEAAWREERERRDELEESLRVQAQRSTCVSFAAGIAAGTAKVMKGAVQSARSELAETRAELTETLTKLTEAQTVHEAECTRLATELAAANEAVAVAEAAAAEVRAKAMAWEERAEVAAADAEALARDRAAAAWAEAEAAQSSAVAAAVAAAMVAAREDSLHERQAAVTAAVEATKMEATAEAEAAAAEVATALEAAVESACSRAAEAVEAAEVANGRALVSETLAAACWVTAEEHRRHLLDAMAKVSQGSAALADARANATHARKEVQLVRRQRAAAAVRLANATRAVAKVRCDVKRALAALRRAKAEVRRSKGQTAAVVALAATKAVGEMEAKAALARALSERDLPDLASQASSERKANGAVRKRQAPPLMTRRMARRVPPSPRATTSVGGRDQPGRSDLPSRSSRGRTRRRRRHRLVVLPRAPLSLAASTVGVRRWQPKQRHLAKPGIPVYLSVPVAPVKIQADGVAVPSLATSIEGEIRHGRIAIAAVLGCCAQAGMDPREVSRGVLGLARSREEVKSVEEA